MRSLSAFLCLLFGVCFFNTAWASECKWDLFPDKRDIAGTSYESLVRSITLPSGTRYRYIFKRPAWKSRPWLLFLHGFPSSSYDWRRQVEYFGGLGYGIIAPDMLGCGGTDNPDDLTRYSLKNIVADIDSLLDCENVDTVFAIGHDLGSIAMSRLITYSPTRLQGVVFLDIGYIAPPLPLNRTGIEGLNNATLAAVGYPIFGYWYFMDEDDAAPIMDAHVDSAFSLIYTNNSTYGRDHFSPVGALKQWLLADRRAPFGGFVDQRTMKTFNSIVSQQGGFDGPTKWYKAFMRDINTADEAEIPPTSAKIQQPVLFIGAARDPVGIAAMQVNTTAPYAPNMKVRSVDSGHFLQLEKPLEVNTEIAIFVHEVLKNATA